MRLARESIKSPLGPILLYLDEQEVVRVSNFEDREDHLNHILRRQYGRIDTYPIQGKSSAARSIEAYFGGELHQLGSIRIDPPGTEFQRAIWFRLREIEPGTTLSYGALAVAIGRPAASRAVGAANGANPINLIIPCHRLVGASLDLTGYGPGLSRKRWLLNHEGCQAKFRG